MNYLYIYLPIIWMVLLRIVYSFNTFSEFGGMSVRNKLFEESVSLLRKNFFFGVGRGMFIPALFNENPTGVIIQFPESVHNGIILNIIENGFFSFISFCLFYFFLFRKLSLLKSNKNFSIFAFALLLAQFLISFFHPITNLISIYTFVLILIVYDLHEVNF